MDYVSLEQKKIVVDRSLIRKISGCAGSRKTDTMIKCGIYYLQNSIKPRSCLFLTLVGSVTDEIKERISSHLNIKIERQGISNHYIGYWKNHTIEIANYDAFIHRQLQEHYDDDDENIDMFSSDFDKKAETLYEIIKNSEKHQQLLLKNGSAASIILVDEFQDISSIRAQILIEYFKKNKTTTTRLVVLGDILQTIFPQALKEFKHSLLLIDELKPTSFRLNKCFRCPKGHLDVVNCITKTFRAQYNIPEMESHFDLENNKPLFFTHDAVSTNYGALETATTVYQMIKTLLCHDRNIDYKDIVIIMKKSNHQMVFQQIANLFIKHNLGDKFLLSKTKSFQNDHSPINWEEGKEKLMMLSIHGDKGKGHPVVFFLGFSGGTIPEERHFYKIEELLSQSLVNVALTRSTKYLFIGMTRTYPSFYFFQCYHELQDLAYFSWKSNLIKHEVIKKVCTEGIKNYNDYPIMNKLNIRKKALQIPLRNIIFINQDDRCKYLMKKCNITKYKIGKSLQWKIEEEKLYIINSCIKILFLKKIKSSLLKTVFVPFLEMFITENVHFTDDNNILSHIKDNHLNKYVIKDVHFWTQTIKKIGLRQFDHPVLIIHSVFKESIYESLINVINNDRIDYQNLWKVSIFYLEYIENQSIYNILFFYHSNFMFDDIHVLEENILSYSEFYKNDQEHGLRNIRFMQKASIIDTIKDRIELEDIGFQYDLDADKKIFQEGFRFGLSSTIDFIDTKNKILIDLKISLKSECKTEWIFQNIINSLLSHNNNYIKINKIHIYNVLKGYLYTFHLSSKYKLLEIMDSLLKEYEFSPVLISKLSKFV